MGMMELRRQIILMNEPHLETSTGSTIQIVNAEPSPLKQCKVSFMPVQSGSGNPSPSNVRPISGWTGINIVRNDTTIPVSWQTEAGTVYYGEADIINGILTVTYKYVLYTGASSESWNMETLGSGKNFYIKCSDAVSTGDTSYLYCNMALPSTSVTQGTTKISNSLNLNVCLGSATGATSVAEWRTWLGSNNLQVVYKLASPVTYQFAPQTIRTLRGLNNITTNANGSITATYWTH